VIFLAAVFVLDRGPEVRVALGKGVLLGKHFLAFKKMFQSRLARCVMPKTKTYCSKACFSEG
jgi:hypothetical protein